MQWIPALVWVFGQRNECCEDATCLIFQIGRWRVRLPNFGLEEIFFQSPTLLGSTLKSSSQAWFGLGKKVGSFHLYGTELAKNVVLALLFRWYFDRRCSEHQSDSETLFSRVTPLCSKTTFQADWQFDIDDLESRNCRLIGSIENFFCGALKKKFE